MFLSQLKGVYMLGIKKRNKSNKSLQEDLEKLDGDFVGNTSLNTIEQVAPKVVTEEEFALNDQMGVKTADESNAKVEGDGGINLNVAKILGKSQQDLKNEFFKYQLDMLLQKLGGIPKKSLVSFTDAEDFLLQGYRAGITEYIVSPFEFAIYKNIQKRHNLKNATFLTLCDELKGEGSFKGRLASAKILSKTGADGVVLPFPSRAWHFSCVGENKRKTIKIIKNCKKPIVLAIDNIEQNATLKTIKAIQPIKAKAIMLVANEFNFEKIQATIKGLLEVKFNKKLYVKCSCHTVEDFILLQELKADKIFTPFANELAKELSYRIGLN